MAINFSNVKEFSINGTDIKSIDINNVRVWKKPSDTKKWFYVENIGNTQGTLTITRSASSSPNLAIQYSYDGSTWTDTGSYSSNKKTITVPANSKVYLRCNTNSWSKVVTSSSSTTIYTHNISFTNNHNIGGNILSLLYGESFTGEETSFKTTDTYIFYSLFQNNSTLIDASDLELPVLSLTGYCYQYLFNGCTALTKAPELPATTIAMYCYDNLFYGCTSLTSAPSVLPATTLQQSAYRYMFRDCSQLKVAPEIMATSYAYHTMQGMFWGCKTLEYIKVHFTGNWPGSPNDTTKDWTRLTVNTTGKFVCPTGLTSYFNASGNNTTGSAISGYCNAIPYGWTVEKY